MSEPEETVDATKDQNEENEEVSAPNPEAQPSADQEPQQEVHFEENVNEAEIGSAGETLGPESSTTKILPPGDADNATVEDESHADFDKKSMKEDDEFPVIASVSFADVVTKESREAVGRTGSIASAMSYDSLTSLTDVETKAKTALGSIISIRRGSTTGGEYYDRHRIPKYMNSYKLAPDKPFHVEKVEKFMREILSEALENAAYDADKTPKQAKWASSAMRAKLKEQEYDRCKFICIVTMGEKRSQDVQSIIRFLWDPDRDKFAHVVLENMSVFAVAVCFGIYYE